MQAKHKIKPVEPLIDFAQVEEKLLKYWYKSGVVKKYLRRNKTSKKRFSFLDGPITANNPMGVHHGWGRTYKDLWQRYYNMKGFRQRFQNGFDAQGLWIEVEVEKKLGFKSKKDVEQYGVSKFVQMCKDRVFKYSKIQTEQSKRLGYFMDWDNSYFTLSDENNYMIWHFLKICHTNNWLYKGKDSVPWCPRCQTAISQHEMLTEDYKDVTHKSIYLALPIKNRKNESLLIWTTTPWTIPANIAVAVDEKLDYSLIKTKQGQKYWVASDVINRVFAGEKPSIVNKVKGKKLVGLKYESPFDQLPKALEVARKNPKSFHVVIPTDTQILEITTVEGTGLVHTAVSAGTEDFKLGKKLKLPMIPVIADNADYLEGLGFLTGKNAKKHPQIILDYIVKKDKKKDQHWIYKIVDYKHRYPACWRCKTELVWKVTDEWYIAMDKGKPSLRQRMKKVAKQIHWLPSFGLDRELDWLNNMHDWLISKKNRYWGLSLPIWECNKCGNIDVIGSKAELKKRAITGWKQFAGKTPHKPQIDKIKIRCSKCHQLISRVEPVGNPWLDAGIVSFSTISQDNKGTPLYKSNRDEWRKWFPVDFITESFPGQFKNWFYSLIAMSTVLENTNPFKTVLGFATLFGEDGRPMHKSWGNAIEFNEGAKKIGVDVMRWLYCRQNPTSNLLFGYKVASEVKRQFHLIIWNSYRFFANYSALDNWYPKKTLKPSYTLLDCWILSRLTNTQEKLEEYLDNYDAFHATQVIEEFISDFSSWYIRRSRERIGPAAANSTDKNTCYYTLFTILTTLAKILAPFMPFLTDRMYTNLTGFESVHLADWPNRQPELKNKSLEDKMTLVREIVELAHAARKEKGIKVRQPLSAVLVSGCRLKLDQQLKELIKEELNIKSVNLRKTGKTLKVKLDTHLTDSLIKEGQAREFIRSIQQQRKQLKTALDEYVQVTTPSYPKGFISQIKEKTLSKEIKIGKIFKVERLK